MRKTLAWLLVSGLTVASGASAQTNGWTAAVPARTNVITAARIDDVYVKVETNGAHYAYVGLSLVDPQGGEVTRLTVPLDAARISAMLAAAGTDVPRLIGLLLYLGGTGAATLDRLVILVNPLTGKATVVLYATPEGDPALVTEDALDAALHAGGSGVSALRAAIFGVLAL